MYTKHARPRMITKPMFLIVGLCLPRLLDKGCCQGQELNQRARARCYDAGQQADDSHPQPQCARGHVNDE